MALKHIKSLLSQQKVRDDRQGDRAQEGAEKVDFGGQPAVGPKTHAEDGDHGRAGAGGDHRQDAQHQAVLRQEEAQDPPSRQRT